MEERRSPESYLSVLATNLRAKLLGALTTNSVALFVGWRDICYNFLMLNFLEEYKVYIFIKEY